VDAALDLVQEQGVAALTLREVARRVEVTHAAPYRHFKDKSALLAAVAEEGFKRLSTRLGDARREASTSETLAATGVAYLRFAVQHPAHYRVMFGTESETGRSATLEAAATDVIVELRALCAEGSGRDDTEASEEATALWAQWHGLALLHLGGWLELQPPAPSPKLLTEALDATPSTPPPTGRELTAPPSKNAEQASPATDPASSSPTESSAPTPLDGPDHSGSDHSDSTLDVSNSDETGPHENFR